MDSEAIRLLADYLCFPIWTDDRGDIDPRTLPISKKLADDLLEWACFYDTTLDQEYPPDSHFSSAEERDLFIEHGWELKNRLQRELGNDYEITYVVSRLPVGEPGGGPEDTIEWHGNKDN